MKLIIQVPCLNEAETLHLVINDLPTHLPGFDTIETLVIDDGSTDSTAATALGLGVNHVIRHRRNRGLAASFDAGLRASLDLGADVIVNTDGDHQYPGRYIADLVSPIVAGGADLAIGNRNSKTLEQSAWIKRLPYRTGRVVIERLSGSAAPDPTSGFRAMTAELANRMVIATRYTHTIETETLLGAIDCDAAINWVPIKKSTDRTGK